jgi:predicted hotdog family 3-hydroxylacyl-ACP dehydratase
MQMEAVIEIQNYLPHRAPMLMVDLIITMDENNVQTTFLVEEDNIFVDNGVFYESGLIENAAQTCSAIVANSYFRDKTTNVIPEVIGFISSIRSIHIHSLPGTGSEITTIASLISSFDTGSYITCMMSCKTFCGEALLLEGEINLFIQERQDEKK